MNGAQALRYARSRHTSTDFDRAPAPAARPAVAPRAGRPAGADPAPARAGRRAQAGGPDGHPDRPARRAARARVGDRHQEHPLVRVRAAALPEGVPVQPARLHHRPVRRQDPGGRPRRVHDRPGGRGARARSWPRRAPTVWVLNSTGDRDRGARLAGYLEYHGLAASAPRQTPPGGVQAEHEDRRLQRRRGDARRRRSPTSSSSLGVTATIVTDPAIRTDIVVTIGRATPDLEAPVLP